jgi:hypothetical protein
MIDQNSEGANSADSAQHRARNTDFREAAKEAFHKVADKARDAGEQAKRATAGATSTVSEQVVRMLNEQVGSGVQSASLLANSMKRAGEDLSRDSPVLAGLISGLADTVSSYADRLEGQTVDELSESVSAFGRRQPALTIGLAAVAGFFVFRTFKNAASVASPPIQPHERTGDTHD